MTSSWSSTVTSGVSTLGGVSIFSFEKVRPRDGLGPAGIGGAGLFGGALGVPGFLFTPGDLGGPVGDGARRDLLTADSGGAPSLAVR